MTSIGTFGRTYAPVDLDFQFFELTVRVNPACSQLGLVEFLAEAGEVSQEDEVRGSQVIMRLLREIVHPDDWPAFWGVAKRESQDPQHDLMPLAQAVMEAVSNFRSGQQSGLPNGDSATPQKSVTVVDLPDGMGPPLAGRTLQALKIQGDRPDLHLAVPDLARQERAG